MATIYKFQDSEAYISSTTTSTGASGATLGSTDAILVFNQLPLKTNQTTIGGISATANFQSLSSAANLAGTIAPAGYVLITTTSTIGSWFLGGAPAAGRYLTISLSGTCTTTAALVTAQSTAIVIFSTGSSSSTVKPWQQIQFGQPGAYVDLISQSTGIWQVLGASLSPSIAFATTTGT